MDHFGVLCFVFVLFSCQFIAALLSTAEERAELLDLLCVIFYCFCHFPMWWPGSGVMLDCIDSLSLPYFLLSLTRRLTRQIKRFIYFYCFSTKQQDYNVHL